MKPVTCLLFIIMTVVAALNVFSPNRVMASDFIVSHPLPDSFVKSHPQSTPEYSSMIAEPIDDQREEEVLEERKDEARKVLSNLADDILSHSDLGRKIKKIEKAGQEFFKFEYRKTIIPNHQLTHTEPNTDPKVMESSLEQGFGITFSPKFKLKPNELLDDVTLELKSNYFSTFLNTTYALDDNELTLELSNTALNRFIGATTQFCINKDETGTACLIQVEFDF